MKYMMIVKASAESEAGVMPSEELLAEMGNYNDQLLRAGVLLDLNALQATSKGFRVRHVDGRKVVTDGPFGETKELIAGYWLIQTNSREEALDWALRCPADVEVRLLFDLDDFQDSPSIQRARELGQELVANK